MEHRHERGKTAETMTNKIVDEQRIDVDAVSGAANSSIVIKKAVAKSLSVMQLLPHGVTGKGGTKEKYPLNISQKKSFTL